MCKLSALGIYIAPYADRLSAMGTLRPWKGSRYLLRVLHKFRPRKQPETCVMEQQAAEDLPGCPEMEPRQENIHQEGLELRAQESDRFPSAEPGKDKGGAFPCGAAAEQESGVLHRPSPSCFAFSYSFITPNALLRRQVLLTSL